jgi:polyisoprenoid-binding protein YceI
MRQLPWQRILQLYRRKQPGTEWSIVGHDVLGSRIPKNAAQSKSFSQRTGVDFDVDQRRNPKQLIMNRSIPVLLLLFAAFVAQGQPLYVSKTNTTSFFAGTAVEDIDATNTKAVSLLNVNTGELSISIPNKEFHFKRALMEEHFNENYMESGKYPKSEFKGKIKNPEQYNFASTTPFTLSVTGTLTIHGVAKERTMEVTVVNQGGKIEGKATFTIALSDHNIDRPKILWEKLAETVNVTTTFTYEPYKK